MQQKRIKDMHASAEGSRMPAWQRKTIGKYAEYWTQLERFLDVAKIPSTSPQKVTQLGADLRAIYICNIWGTNNYIGSTVSL